MGGCRVRPDGRPAATAGTDAAPGVGGVILRAESPEAADLLARLTSIREAVEDGDPEYARTLLIDLELDLEQLRERRAA